MLARKSLSLRAVIQRLPSTSISRPCACSAPPRLESRRNHTLPRPHRGTPPLCIGAAPAAIRPLHIVPQTSNQHPQSPPYNDLTYYTFGTPNGLKPAIVLEELGLNYKCEKIDITKDVQKEDWYLEINPNGRIPALKDGAMRVFESGAIMLYLADQYDGGNRISYEHGTVEYYEMLSWLMFQMGGIGPMQGQANHFLAMASARSDYSIKRYLDETKRLYSVLEIRLSNADWLAGDKYTIADIANYSWVRVGPIALEIDLSQWPGVDSWVKRIDERDAVARAKKIPAGTRSAEEMVEVFKEMREKIQGMENVDRY